jgi:hypothetical protein
MRLAQILTPALIALATAACARQQTSYYMPTPATQRPAAQRYTQAPAASHNRGLLTSPQVAQQAYAQPSYAQASYGRPTYQPPPQREPSGRGLFNSYAASQTNYPPPAYAQPTYAPQPAAQPRYAQRTYAQSGYAQQQPRYAPRSAPTQYQPPTYATGGPYVAARTSNPFATARWY